MGTITIQKETTIDPISLIGREAGVCWGAETGNAEKDYKRGLDCIKSGHGRTMEYPQIYMIIDGYSARVIRELYTHIAGGPTRLQASTRYIDYESGFTFVTPPSIAGDPKRRAEYEATMDCIADSLKILESMGTPREDTAMLLPLGMTTKVVLRTNLRNLVDMSHQRMCTRAYWEFRQMMKDMLEALKAYGWVERPDQHNEWAELADLAFKPKCEVCGFCEERKSCGRMPKRA